VLGAIRKDACVFSIVANSFGLCNSNASLYSENKITHDTYDTTIKNYGYDISMQFQIFQLFKNSINITSNTSINLYNYIILPTTMIAVKIPYKCKRVFITNDYINPYENPSEIVPFVSSAI
jgi:hypothetical protein